MKTSVGMLAVIGAFSLSFKVAAQDQGPRSVLEALPSADALGPGWSREISLLFDPASKPAEIVGASVRLPDSFRKKKRNAVENPTNQVSGWCHAHFIFQATNRTQHYEVQMERYWSKEKVAEDFRQLLAFDAKEYQKTEVQGIGEAAVVYRNASGMTLWFRRGNFRAWISPLSGSSQWEDDFGLQQLAGAFDKRLSDEAFRAEPSVEANPLPKILQDWGKRRQDGSMITYRLSGTRTWPRGAFTHVSPPGDSSATNTPAENPSQAITGFVNSTITLDFKNNRCRIEREEDDYNNSSRHLDHRRIVEVGIEGIANVHVLTNSDPSAAKGPSKPPVDFLIKKGDQSRIPPSSFERGYYYPLFFGSGIVSTKDQRVKTVNIAPIVNSSAFTFESYRTERGRQLAMLRVDYDNRYRQTSRYEVDLNHDSAIVNFTSQIGSAQGNLMICNIDYALTDDFWLPQRWTTTYLYHGRTNLTESITVSETLLLKDIASERFELKPSPGMYIQEFEHFRDPQTKELVVKTSSYRLNADGNRSEQSSKIDRNPDP